MSSAVQLAILFMCTVAVHQCTACNEAVCASSVSKCLLLKSCECDMTNRSNCTCCTDCHRCLARLYTDCCSCVGKECWIHCTCYALSNRTDWLTALVLFHWACVCDCWDICYANFLYITTTKKAKIIFGIDFCPMLGCCISGLQGMSHFGYHSRHPDNFHKFGVYDNLLGFFTL